MKSAWGILSHRLYFPTDLAIEILDGRNWDTSLKSVHYSNQIFEIYTLHINSLLNFSQKTVHVIEHVTLVFSQKTVFYNLNGHEQLYSFLRKDK